MSGIIGSKLNHRGSGPVAKLGTDGQHLLSSGAGKSANYETVASATYDDDKLQSNIALLGFKTAVNGSLAKYNLQDQIIDEYEDATGIDAGNSTNERLTSGVYYGASGSNPTGATSTDTSVAGYTTLVLSAASGNIVVSSSGNVDILVVGGGGSGGSEYGGGGGAGGLIYKPSHALTAQTYAWVTGAGGAGQSTVDTDGNNGEDTTWTDASASVEFTAKGGGGGGGENRVGLDGGSGGGNSYNTPTPGADTQSAQSGDSGTYGFGFDGGVGIGAPNYNPAGGGGAGSVGQAGTTAKSGDGGTGKDYSAIFGTAVGDSGWFASGGGGGFVINGNHQEGSASSGGGTAGGTPSYGNSSAATANTGGGSGGGAEGAGDSGNGGSGIILLRYADGTFETAGGDLTLQSTDTTASTANPDYADMVCLIEDAEGTATLNTDIKGYISEDSGATFTQGTFVDEGSWGTNKKIIAFHDLDISAQSGSSMCYKITTHNQSTGSLETKIHATSIGWKA